MYYPYNGKGSFRTAVLGEWMIRNCPRGNWVFNYENEDERSPIVINSRREDFGGKMRWRFEVNGSERPYVFYDATKLEGSP